VIPYGLLTTKQRHSQSGVVTWFINALLVFTKPNTSMKNIALSVVTPPITPPFTALLHPQKMKGCSFKIICKTNKLNKLGLAPVTLQYFLGKQKGELAVGISIPPDIWDPQTQKIQTKYYEYNAYNLIIEQHRSTFNQILIDLTLQQITITKELLKERFEQRDSREDFIIYFENKLYQRRNQAQIDELTFKANSAILHKCKLFKAQWPFASIDIAFLEKFSAWHIKYLEKNAVANHRPLKNKGLNTNSSALKCIKTYLRLAHLIDGIRFNMPKIKLNWIPTSREFLTEHELRTLIDMYNINFFEEHPFLKAPLEMFLFSCCTAMRISDVKRVRITDFEGGFINIIPHKNRKYQRSINIPINDFINRIIQGKRDYIFPPLSEQKVNKHLKEIAYHAGIDKDLTMNVGRHTFATLWLQKGGTLKALQDIMGHQSSTTTANYLHKDNGHLKREMEKSISQIFNKLT